MYNISTDQIIQNLHKMHQQYQEIMLQLMQGKGSLIPSSLINDDKHKLILSKLYEQFCQEPEKFINLQIGYTEKFCQLISNTMSKFIGMQTDPIFTPANQDRRFKDTAWQDNIFFDFIKQFYLMLSDYLKQNISQYELDIESQQYLKFITEQFINAISPSNSIFCNPEVLRTSLDSGWQNIVDGLDKLLSDIKKSNDIFTIPTTDKSAFQFYKNIATTPGKVVLQNDLMQLICYQPKQNSYAIPILIIPPCINKYYILDLSPYNSLVSFLIQHNFQPFIVSWKNPDQKLAHKNFEDYLYEGVVIPCQHIIGELGYKKINMMGYCIGGTLLATAIAYMASNDLNYVNNASFLTTLLDFTNSGEISVFINETSIATIEAEMQLKGYFDGRYLSNSFSLLRANDLVWSFFIHNYLLGKTPIAFDILYWNADHTNLPASMHSYYLRNMYLNNLLKIPNALKMRNTAIDLGKIDCNSFFLAAQEDHIAPWRGVYNSTKLLNGNKQFVLTSSGHVAGVVNPPVNAKYSYKTCNALYDDPEDWLAHTTEFKGSWWNAWQEWLADNSGQIIHSIDYDKLKFIEYAPGRYVQE